MPNNFHEDDAWQREVRDRVLVPAFYEPRAAGRFVLLDKGKFATVMQRRRAVDTIAQSAKTGEASTFEEKIVRWVGRKYTALCLETDSCTIPGRESPGWMHYGRADYLLYCMAQDKAATVLDCHLVDFQALREWFWPLIETFPTFEMPNRNRTRGRNVPISKIAAAVPYWHFTLNEPKVAAA